MSWRSVRRLLASAGIVGAAVLAFSGSALPVQAASAANSSLAPSDFARNGSFGSIINFNGQCLDMINASTQQGTQAQVNPCNGQSRQRWAMFLVGNGDLLVQNERSRLCLSILNNFTGVGGRVVQWPCSASNRFEQWKLFDPNANGVEIANIGDGGLVMHPAVCTSALGAEIYVNVSNQCRVDFWHG
jgi:hypothetical protein